MQQHKSAPDLLSKKYMRVLYKNVQCNRCTELIMQTRSACAQQHLIIYIITIYNK